MGEKAKVEDYIGEKYNELTILGDAGTKDGRTLVKCRCDCGNEIVRPLIIVKNGNTKSCGCRQKRVLIERNLKHGFCTRKSKDRLYVVWSGIRKRCYDPNNKEYKNYGARGITVCEEWLNNYSAFRDWAYANGYDERAKYGECTIDRIDKNGNYEPSNCRWVNSETQANNTRSNVVLSYEGQQHTLAEWSRIRKINYRTMETRYIKGHQIEDILYEGSLTDKYKGRKIKNV